MIDPTNRLKIASQTFCEEMGLGEDVYVELLTNAMADINADTSLLHKAIAVNDRDEVQAISHRLKGIFSNLRLNDIVPYAKTLNDLAKSNATPHQFSDLLHQIESLVKSYAQAIGN